MLVVDLAVAVGGSVGHDGGFIHVADVLLCCWSLLLIGVGGVN